MHRNGGLAVGTRVVVLFVAALGPGCASTQPTDDGRIDFSRRTIQSRVRMHLASSVELEPGMRTVDPESAPRLYLIEPPVVTERDIYAALALHGERESVVRVQFTSVAAARLQSLTSQNTGGWLAILVDDELLAAPRIQGAVVSDAFVLRGKFSKAKAEELAAKLHPRADVAPE